MGSYNVCLFTLLMLAAFQNMMAYPIHDGSSTSSDMLPMADEYLGYLFNDIENSGRRPNSNGEVNLLPEDTNQFANVVQCIPEEPSNSGSEIASSSGTYKRILRYNLIHSFISSTQKLVAFRLVIPSSAFPCPFEINVYKVVKSVVSTSPEDSADSRQRYIDLHVALFDHPNKYPLEEDSMYEVAIEIKPQDASVTNEQVASTLTSLKPMLVVYSYDGDILKHLFQVPDSSKVLKRSVSEVENPPADPFEELKQDFCQIHSVNLSSFDHIVSPLYEVLNPSYFTMSFCYGHCRIQGQNDPNAHKVSDHSKFVGYQEPDFEEAGISPCCVPTSYSLTSLELRRINSGELMMFIIENHVNSCGCF